MIFQTKTFQQLTTEEIYQILRLRAAIFVVEQDCVYQDVDAKDQKAIHVFTTNNNNVIAYARIFNKNDYFKEASIGRVVVAEKHRKKGVGHVLMEEAIKAVSKNYHTKTIKISAQTYLKSFYKSHGFNQIGEGYLEDGIPHIAMVK